ncbi:tetratricopeptide repeat protein [Streptomyces sp. NPDC101206]|uniref:tetratricopeptide repeat protein n=1 Tax=Streptomyces sp. NPDC101206 TaxID=3366128 RepID=UPI003805C414
MIPPAPDPAEPAPDPAEPAPDDPAEPPPGPADGRPGSAGAQPAPTRGQQDGGVPGPGGSRFSGPTAVQFGSGNVQHIHFPAPPTPVAWPHVVGLPPNRAQGFRRRELAVDLAEPGPVTPAAAAADGAGDLTSWVLVGLGGTGKTQIAADHAGRLLREGRIDLLLWVTAGSRDAVLAAYATAAEGLFGASGGNPERAAAEFLTWLLPRPAGPGWTPRRWLVVLDDVADPADLRGLWPPPSPYGRTLVTTRRQEAALGGDLRRLVRVGLFTADEAVAYLAEGSATAGRRDPRPELAALAEDLGRLPLALAHARTYLADNPTLSCAAYREELADRRLTLAEVFPSGSAVPDGDAGPGGAAADPDADRGGGPVSLTWALSVRRADALTPGGAALPVLRVASYLDPNGIPEEVLAAPSVLALLPHDAGPGTRAARLALANLRRLSLVELDPERPRSPVRVHQLVQRAVREDTAGEETARAIAAAADALMAVWEREPEPAPPAEEALRANATALTATAGEALLAPLPHEVLYRMGRSLGEAGRSGAAIAHFAGLLGEVRARFPDDADLLFKTRGYLAWWTAKSGDARGGAEAFEALLADQLRVLAPDCSDVLQTRRSAAVWRGAAGDARTAVTKLEALHTDWVRVEGSDAPGAASTRNHLANMRARLGDHTGALALHGEALREAESRFGTDDPRTVRARAEAMRHRGELGEPLLALRAFTDLAAVRRESAPDHPDTFGTRAAVAEWTGRSGDPAGAVRLLEELHADRARVLGPAHAHTLAGREELARWRAEAGDVPGAVADLEALIPDQIAALGLDNPAVDRTTRLLARWTPA